MLVCEPVSLWAFIFFYFEFVNLLGTYDHGIECINLLSKWTPNEYVTMRFCTKKLNQYISKNWNVVKIDNVWKPTHYEIVVVVYLLDHWMPHYRVHKCKIVIHHNTIIGMMSMKSKIKRATKVGCRSQT